jgi:hypothetical protein
MPSFILTARSDINRPNGLHIGRGDEINVNINVAGINQYNLFNNSRCKEFLVRQFQINGIDVPQNDSIFSRGTWDIKMGK